MKRQKSKRQNKRFFVAAGIAAAIVVIVGTAAVALHLHDVHNAQKHNGTVGGVSVLQTTSPNDNKSQSSASGNGSTSSNKDSGATTGSGTSGSASSSTPSSTPSTIVALIAPYGTFVSNHRPGQNNSPTTEQSECTTTPGATCDITFTNSSGVVKTLGVQTVGASGTVTWNWNITGSNLAPGTWKVAAVAALNDQSKTTTDATPLEIE